MDRLSNRLRRRTMWSRPTATLLLLGKVLHTHGALAQSVSGDNADVTARLKQLTIQNQQLAAENKLLIQLLVQNKVLTSSQARPLLQEARLPRVTPAATS
jgi:hypothetical protein